MWLNFDPDVSAEIGVGAAILVMHVRVKGQGDPLTLKRAVIARATACGDADTLTDVLNSASGAAFHPLSGDPVLLYPCLATCAPEQGMKVLRRDCLRWGHDAAAILAMMETMPMEQAFNEARGIMQTFRWNAALPVVKRAFRTNPRRFINS